MTNQARIFDGKTDFYLFIILPLVLLGLLFFQGPVCVQMAWGILVVDQLHVYFTYIQVGFWKKITEDQWRFYKIAGICLFCFLLAYGGFFIYGIVAVFVVVKYLTMFHFCRQQYGWLRLIQGKMQISSGAALLSEIALQVFCLMPLLIGHSKKYYFSWFVGVPNLFSIPDGLADLFWTSYILFCLSYLIFEIYAYNKDLYPFNSTRLSILIFTFICWNLTFLGHKDLPHLRVFLLAGHHVLSYIYLVYYFNTVRGRQSLKKFAFSTGAVLALFLVIVLFRNSIQGLTPARLQFLRLSLSDDIYKYFYPIIPFLWALTIFHFILDGFIWKKNLH